MGTMENTFLITDLDGTLLPASKEILPKDLEAIRHFCADGGKFAIATGRTLQASIQYLRVLQPEMPLILYNGAAIYDPISHQMRMKVTLPRKTVEIVRIVLDAFPDASAEILTADGTYVARMTEYEREHLAICRVEPICLPLEDIPQGEWLKVLFAIAPKRMSALIVFFEEQGWDCADFVQSDPRFYEVLPKGTTKGSALRQYRNLCHLDDCRVVAAGDFDNDLEMLQEADLSACPSNAQPCVKETVDIQLNNSCETHAIAELIARLYEM